MRLAEGAQSWQEPAGCEGADDPDADDTPEVTLLEPLQRCPQTAERFRDCGNQSLSFIGQCQPAGQPPKQLNAETRLEALDLMADGRLTHPHPHTRFGEAQTPRRSLDRPHRTTPHTPLCHAQALNFLMADRTNDHLWVPDP